MDLNEGSSEGDDGAGDEAGTNGGTGDSAGAGAGEAGVPGWWPYEQEFPRWQVWRGVDRLYYATLRDANPPVRVRGEDPVDLRDQIRAHLLRPAP